MSLKYNPLLEDDLQHVLSHTLSIWEEMRNATIFLTGGTGFFGKWLLESFSYACQELNLNACITVLTRNKEAFLSLHPYFDQPGTIDFIEGDILNFTYDKTSFDYIIHAATDADASLNELNPLLMMDTITLGTRRILDFALKQGALKSILFTSSGAVYGKQPENITHINETDSFPIDINNPANAYAEGKRIAELYCSTYFKKFGLPVRIARCFAFVGPYLPLDKHFAIGNFLRNALYGENIIIKGDGTAYRSYLYAADLAIWLWKILLEGKPNQAYNAGSDSDLTIAEAAQAVQGFMPQIEVKILGKQQLNIPVERYVPNISFAKENLSLSVFTDLKQSIAKTLNFYHGITNLS